MFTLIVAAALTAAACANPSIVSALVQSKTTNGGLNHYAIAVTVQNQGTLRQPSNLLQSIDVFQDGFRVDRMGLQPLRPKQVQNARSGKNVDCGAGN